MRPLFLTVILLLNVIVRCSSADLLELDAGLVQKTVLWLRDDTGVEVDGGSVASWADVNGRHRFDRIAEDKAKLLLDKVQARIVPGTTPKALTDAILRADHGAPRQQQGATPFSPGSIKFPCGMVSRDFRLHQGMTLFVVIRPAAFEPGDQAIGQRFLGHYPFGQMRFRDGLVAFRSKDGEYVLHGSTMQPRAGEWNVVGYRFGASAPEASLNDAPFTSMTPIRGAASKPVVFSTDSVVTLGGTNVDCSFVGDISEVLVFGSLLNPDETSRVLQYLNQRHEIPESNARLASNSMDSSLALTLGATEPVSYGRSSRARRPRAPEPPRQRSPPQERQQQSDGSKMLRGTPSMGADGRSAADLLAQMEELKQKLDLMMNNGRGGGASAPLIQSHGNAQPMRSMPAAMSISQNNQCRGGDMFRNQPIEGWKPPEHARIDELQTWEDTYKQTFHDISHSELGGKPLRQFIHTKVNELRILRQSLFCKYAAQL